MKCSIQVALLPHRLTWSAFLGEWAPRVVVVAVIVPKGSGDLDPSIAWEPGHVVLFVPKGPGD